VKLFHILAACEAERLAKVGVAIETNECLGERVGILRLDENSVANYFRHGRRPRSHNGFARSHRFQKYDAETLLHTGQAEYVASVVFSGQPRDGDVAEPIYHPSEIQFMTDPSEPMILRPVSYNADLQLRNDLP